MAALWRVPVRSTAMPSSRRPRFRWWHSAGVLILLAAALSAVLFFPADEPVRDKKKPSGGPPGTGPLTAVSIGDSSLSGEGTGDYDLGTNGTGGNWCHRSPHSTIHTTRVPGVTKTINLACSGAATEHVRLTKARKYTEGSQAAQLRELLKTHRVIAVVVGIGANDDPHFSRRLTECAKAYWGGAPCTAAFAPQWTQTVERMRPKVVQALADVRSVLAEAGYRTTDYQLVLLSYPSPVSPDIPEPLRSLDGCPFRVSDLQWISTTGVQELATGLRRAADEAGARFLDFSRAGEGHEACTGGADARSEWFTRLTVQWTDLDDLERATHAAQESYHANKAGHAQFGRCITEFINAPEPRAACLSGADGNLHPAPLP